MAAYHSTILSPFALRSREPIIPEEELRPLPAQAGGLPATSKPARPKRRSLKSDGNPSGYHSRLPCPRKPWFDKMIEAAGLLVVQPTGLDTQPFVEERAHAYSK